MSLSNEILQAIQAAVQAALSSASTTSTSNNNIVISTVSSPTVVVAPATGSASAAAASSIPLGRSAPSFLSTFSLPSTAQSPSLVASLSSVPLCSSSLSSLQASTLASSYTGYPLSSLPSITPVLHQPFVVGPGHSPVPSKIVSQIVAGKYTDLSDLLPDNLFPGTENEPQLLLDGRLVITSKPKKNKSKIDDIISWTEAFTIFMMVCTHYNPQRSSDLLAYKLLILRTYRKFGGNAWLQYDQRFREHAAATNLQDWSQMNSQLFNFHTAGTGPRLPSTTTICLSWNKGHCASPYSPCRYLHKCSLCSGDHRRVECRKDAPRHAVASRFTPAEPRRTNLSPQRGPQA